MFENLENVLCQELEELDEKYKDGQEISAGDLQKADLVFHALKSAETYKAMKDGGMMDEGQSERSYGGSYGGSYARGRSRMSNRYSRTGSMRSGYDPRNMIDPYWDRR